MGNHVSKDIILKWLKAWSLSRELPLPVTYKSGFKVDVGFENQKTRYVFSKPNDDFFQLSEEINEPYIFLKFCGAPSEIKDKISEKWKIQPQGYMMFCFHPMKNIENKLNENYSLSFENYNSTFVVKILAKNGEIASQGRVVLVDDIAVYDRIITNNSYKRKGLASILMKELEKIALSKQVYQNFLVATEEGKHLYESLGWKLYSLYTSIVIEK
ncbi:GNAT family N-acetyltransferase [Soonwooa sp.]|uniref:GNAT family N-acetyltransferase n=1 Tax=Soonwooa sp. TaxID=1938592 RepID=UPI002610CEDC|nr:GNAT family N-acetyltransferase [Soonwooa sp.]